MRIGILGALFLGIAAAGLADQKEAPPPPACQDEEAMVADYQKSLTELTETVKKEGLPEFQSHYHRKNYLTKLTLYVGLLDGVVGCFDNASHDSKATKDQASGYQTKRDSLTKLKGKLSGYRDSLKASEVDKDAKALIEKFDVSI